MRQVQSEKMWSFLNVMGLAKYESIIVPEFAHESDNFILIEYKGQSVWLPKSKILIEKLKDGFQIRVPTWLKKKMERMAK